MQTIFYNKLKITDEKFIRENINLQIGPTNISIKM